VSYGSQHFLHNKSNSCINLKPYYIEYGFLLPLGKIPSLILSVSLGNQLKFTTNRELSISYCQCISYIVLTLEIGGVVMSGVGGYGAGFALIVVLFILLIIVGTSYVGY
jgi:uncharacterized protein (TIGR01732 family)